MLGYAYVVAKKKLGKGKYRNRVFELLIIHFKPSFGDMCISVVTRNLDAFDMRYIRVAEYQPVRDVSGCETP